MPGLGGGPRAGARAVRAGQEAPQHGGIHTLDTGDLHLHPLVQVTNPLAQDLITPAQYWHDPLNHTLFLSGSHYLADINNEQEEKNSGYRQDCLLPTLHIYLSINLLSTYLYLMQGPAARPGDAGAGEVG